MKYNVKILPEGDKYIGYATINDEVVANTSPCYSAHLAASELEKILKTKPVLNTNVRANRVSVSPSTVTHSSSFSSTPRRCCGRG